MNKPKTLLAALALCALGASAASADVVVRDHRQPTAKPAPVARYAPSKKNDRNDKSQRNDRKNQRDDKQSQRDQRSDNNGRYDRSPAPDYRPNQHIPARPAVVRYAPEIDGMSTAASWYGTIVTISGSHLPLNARIRLDSTTVEPIYASSQRIIFIVPPSRARTTSVTLVAPAGRLDLGSVTLVTRRMGPAFGSASVRFRWSWSS